jgi:stage II sporulation protein P
MKRAKHAFFYLNTYTGSFVFLALGTTLLLVTLGFLFALKADKNVSAPYIEGMAADISMHAFFRALTFEIPYFQEEEKTQAFSADRLGAFSLKVMTGIEVDDKATLLEHQIPGLTMWEGVDLTAENVEEFRMESTLPEVTAGPQEPDPNETKKPALPLQEKKVFLYNTHNYESWTYLSKNDDVANPDKNIMLVNKKLARELERRGVKTKVDQTDHQKILKEKRQRYSFSYAVSYKTVQSALKQDEDIGYIFDIHRDSASKKVTTTTINGKPYAKVLFIIGLRNENWKKNTGFANQIHRELKKQYPGLSRGVNGKGKHEGNAEYNQSLFANSVLMEVGGVDNTQEEIDNTVAALADVIADIYFKNDTKASTPGSPAQKR